MVPSSTAARSTGPPRRACPRADPSPIQQFSRRVARDVTGRRRTAGWDAAPKRGVVSTGSTTRGPVVSTGSTTRLVPWSRQARPPGGPVVPTVVSTGSTTRWPRPVISTGATTRWSLGLDGRDHPGSSGLDGLDHPGSRGLDGLDHPGSRCLDVKILDRYTRTRAGRGGPARRGLGAGARRPRPPADAGAPPGQPAPPPPRWRPPGGGPPARGGGPG